MRELQRRFSNYEFQVIQAHSAEYEFATKTENISKALKKYDVTEIPVGVDSKNETWQAYGNMYWPKHILIDSNGFLRYEHAGYGSIEEFIDPILDMLQETDSNVVTDFKKFESSPTDEIYETYGMHFPQVAPEICVGYSRITWKMDLGQGMCNSVRRHGRKKFGDHHEIQFGKESPCNSWNNER